MRISKITNKNGQEVELGNFNVLVGPNNSGKSQTLRDIHNIILSKKPKTTLISELVIEKPDTFEELFNGLEMKDNPTNMDESIIQGISSNLRGGNQININAKNYENTFTNAENGNFICGNIGQFRVSFLDAESRLVVTHSAETHNSQSEPPQNLLQALYDDSEGKIEDELNSIFSSTFDQFVKLDYSSLRRLYLKVSQDFGEIPEDPRKAAPMMSGFPNIEQQGDGYRSFVGVVLSLLLSKGRIVLLDEPEAFLHPAQARKLGNWIADHSAEFGGQLIISTHNSNFLAGIIASTTETKIFRLNRSKDDTTFTEISSELTQRITNSHILSSQRVLEAIFFKGVVICEADADKAIYQVVGNRYLNNHNFLFIHAHNKQTIKDVSPLFVEAGIPVCGIVDIDILNDGKDFRELIKSFTDSETDELEKIREGISNAILGEDKEKDLFDELKSEVAKLNEALSKGVHEFSGAKTALSIIRSNASLKGNWKQVKKEGISAIPKGSQQPTIDLLKVLKGFGIFVVPKGELEGWFNLEMKKSSKFTIAALEQLNNGNCEEELINFIKEILTKMGEDKI
ncbi:MAG: AAA family ATPase [Cytophagia bacterium]|nr:AAA family ATPase [Cytophagia bacterium]